MCALLAAGLLEQTQHFVKLPDDSFWMGTPNFRQLTADLDSKMIDTGFDRLCQAACEMWLKNHGQHYGLNQSLYWESAGPRHFAALYGGMGADLHSVDHQAAPGLALVNLLAAAGLAGLG